jgi:hypothetical protein
MPVYDSAAIDRRDSGTGPPLRNDGFALKQVHTFQGIVAGVAKTYRFQFDEALRNSQQTALAMRRDGWLMALLRERQMPTARSKWHIEPDDKDDVSQKTAAGILTSAVNKIPHFTKYRLQLLEAIWFGKYANQHVVRRRPCDGKDLWTIVKHQPVNGDKILYRYDGTPGVMVHAAAAADYRNAGGQTFTIEEWKKQSPPGVTIPSDRGMILLLDTPTWRNRFVIHSHENEDADYTEPILAGGINGVGLRHRIYWLCELRLEVISWLLDYLQRVGAGGLTIVWYDEGNAEGEEKAKGIAEQIRTGDIIIAPRPRGQDKQVYGVDRVEPSQVGSQILLDIIDSMFERKIERAIVGQSMSGGADRGDGLGGTGRAEFAQDTKFQLIGFDADNLDDTLTAELIEPLKAWNCPWADFGLRFVSDISLPNPKKKLEAAHEAWEMGATLDEGEIVELTGLSVPKPGVKTLSKAQQQGGGASPPGAAPDATGGQPGAAADFLRQAVDSGRLFDPDELPRLEEELAAQFPGQTGGEGGEEPPGYDGDSGGEGAPPEPPTGTNGHSRLKFAKAKWSSYTNPDTGQSGWISQGGRVVYDVQPPGEEETSAPESLTAGPPESKVAGPRNKNLPPNYPQKAGALPKIRNEIAT